MGYIKSTDSVCIDRHQLSDRVWVQGCQAEWKQDYSVPKMEDYGAVSDAKITSKKWCQDVTPCHWVHTRSVASRSLSHALLFIFCLSPPLRPSFIFLVKYKMYISSCLADLPKSSGEAKPTRSSIFDQCHVTTTSCRQGAAFTNLGWLHESDVVLLQSSCDWLAFL